MRNLYEILQIEPTASARAIKIAYWSLAKRAHPDRDHDKNSPPKTVEEQQRSNDRMAEIISAYAILSDPQARAQFDEQLAQHQAVNNESARTVIAGEICTNAVRHSEQYRQAHQVFIQTYQRDPLARHSIIPFVSNETWGGFEQSAVDNPEFQLSTRDVALVTLLRSMYSFLNAACSAQQVSMAKAELLAIPTHHRHKALYMAAWKVFSNQHDLQVVTTIVEHSQQAEGQLQAGYFKLFQSHGWRSKVILAYTKAAHPNNMHDLSKQAFIHQQWQQFDGRQLVASLVDMQRQASMQLSEDPQRNEQLRSSLRLLTLYQLYEKNTQLVLPSEAQPSAVLRNKLLDLFDWIPPFIGHGMPIYINHLLKITYGFLYVSTLEQDSSHKMADEALAYKCLVSIFSLLDRTNPLIELQLLEQITQLLPLFNYQHAQLDRLTARVAERLNYLLDILPIPLPIQSNITIFQHDIEKGQVLWLSKYFTYLLTQLDSASLSVSIPANKV